MATYYGQLGLNFRKNPEVRRPLKAFNRSHGARPDEERSSIFGDASTATLNGGAVHGVLLVPDSGSGKRHVFGAADRGNVMHSLIPFSKKKPINALCPICHTLMRERSASDWANHYNWQHCVACSVPACPVCAALARAQVSGRRSCSSNGTQKATAVSKEVVAARIRKPLPLLVPQPAASLVQQRTAASPVGARATVAATAAASWNGRYSERSAKCAWSKGDAVEIMYDDGVWYKGRVVAEEPAGVKVT